MNRFLLVVSLSLAAFSIHGQGFSLCNQVVGATGRSANEQGLIYEYTVGEPVIFTLHSPNLPYFFTQGFHQPNLCLPVSVIDIPEAPDLEVEIYPNPTEGWLTVQFTPVEHARLSARVFDLLGQAHTDPLALTTPEGQSLDFSRLAAGVYILHLTDQTSGASTAIRFIKL